MQMHWAFRTLLCVVLMHSMAEKAMEEQEAYFLCTRQQGKLSIVGNTIQTGGTIHVLVSTFFLEHIDSDRQNFCSPFPFILGQNLVNKK